MNVVIIEDEPIAARRLIRQLKELDDQVKILAELKAVESAIYWLQNHPSPDLIFMDVQLEDGICFEIFDHTTVTTPLIFTTAFEQYAIRAFKQNSIDYLLKPINASELDTALEKFRKMHTQTNTSNYKVLWEGKRKERFLVKIGDRYKSIPCSQIQFFYIKERAAFIQTKEGRHYAIDYSLDQVEKVVDGINFFRINRTTILNFNVINEVAMYSNSRLKLNSDNWHDTPLLVSRDRVAAFKQWMDR